MSDSQAINNSNQIARKAKLDQLSALQMCTTSHLCEGDYFTLYGFKTRHKVLMLNDLGSMVVKSEYGAVFEIRCSEFAMVSTLGCEGSNF